MRPPLFESRPVNYNISYPLYREIITQNILLLGIYFKIQNIIFGIFYRPNYLFKSFTIIIS